MVGTVQGPKSMVTIDFQFIQRVGGLGLPRHLNLYYYMTYNTVTRYHKYARVGTYVPHTITIMICCVHACTGTNTANLSKPTACACMNHSITSTLPRTWQDINNSLDPTAASNWRLSSIKKVYFGVKTIAPPPFQASHRLFIE